MREPGITAFSLTIAAPHGRVARIARRDSAATGFIAAVRP